jgi:hypothetical protein
VKPATIAIFIVSLFFASWMLTMAAVLSQWTGVSADISVDDLSAGRLTPLLFGPTMRQQYPSIPNNLSSMFDASALSCIMMGLAAVLFQLRSRQNSSWTALAGALLLLGLAIFLAGAIVLRIGAQTPYEVGSWLALMIYGLLYGAVMALMLAVMDLIGSWRTRRSLESITGSLSLDG